jgi:hypothetical protein
MTDERRWPGGVPPPPGGGEDASRPAGEDAGVPMDEDAAESRNVLLRIKRTAVFAYLVFAVFSWILAGFRGFLGLTCTAAVTMICFLWLEEIAEALLQPAAHRRNARRLTLRAISRFVLLGVALLVTIIVARFDAVSVLLGFSIIVVGIMGEALYSVIRN